MSILCRLEKVGDDFKSIKFVVGVVVQRMCDAIPRRKLRFGANVIFMNISTTFCPVNGSLSARKQINDT